MFEEVAACEVARLGAPSDSGRDRRSAPPLGRVRAEEVARASLGLAVPEAAGPPAVDPAGASEVQSLEGSLRPELADLAPGPAAVALLEGSPLEDLDDYDLVETVAAWRRVAAWAAARSAQAAAVLARRECMNPDWPDSAGTVSEPCVAEVEIALRLGWSRRAGSELVRMGSGFDGGLWLTGEALERGEIDEVKARIISRALSRAPLPVAVAAQEMVLPRAPRRTPSELARDLERALVEADPMEADDRHRRAAAERRVARPRASADGMASLWAQLPAPAAHAVSRGLDAVAWEARRSGDARTHEQLRADALCAAVLGELPAQVVQEPALLEVPAPDRDATDGDSTEPPLASAEPLASASESPVASAEPVGLDQGHRPAAEGLPAPLLTLSELLRRRLTVDVRVVVPMDALLDDAGGAADLENGTAVGPLTARALAAGGTWRRLVTDPTTGTVLDVGRTRYRPPEALARHVRLRDGTCVRPGCTTPAESCDLDHTVPFRADGTGGSTSADNLGPLCRADHLVKTHAGFRLTQPAPGAFRWTTPTGHTYERPAHTYAQPSGPSPWGDALAEVMSDEPGAGAATSARPAGAVDPGPPPF